WLPRAGRAIRMRSSYFREHRSASGRRLQQRRGPVGWPTGPDRAEWSAERLLAFPLLGRHLGDVAVLDGEFDLATGCFVAAPGLLEPGDLPLGLVAVLVDDGNLGV